MQVIFERILNSIISISEEDARDYKHLGSIFPKRASGEPRGEGYCSCATNAITAKAARGQHRFCLMDYLLHC